MSDNVKMVLLKSLGKIVTGNTPKTTNAQNYASRDISFIKPSNIDEISIKTINSTEYYISEYARNSARIIPKDTVVVTCIGIIGKVAILGRECAFNQQINAIVPDNKKVLPLYLAYNLSYRKRYLQDKANAAVVPIINKNDFSNTPICLRDIDTQKEIIARLYECDYIIKIIKNILVKLDELVKSRFIEMFGDIPQSYKMQEVCKIITDGTHQPPKFVNYGIPFIFVSNIVNNYLTYNAEKFITEETYNTLIKRTPIEIGDILLSTVGSYGHTAIVESDRKFLFQRHIAYLKPDHNKVNSLYLHALILSDTVQRQIESKVKGIAQKTLNLSEIRNLQIALPKMELQNQFADFVALADKTKLAARKLLEKHEILKAKLMQDYFA